MFYLFLYKKEDLSNFKKEFDKVKANRDAGKSPVMSEVRIAKTSIYEVIPYNSIAAVFLVLGTYIVGKFNIPELMKVAVVLLMNSICNTIANFCYTIIKHQFRLKLLKRLGVEQTEDNIAVLESLEYQTV